MHRLLRLTLVSAVLVLALITPVVALGAAADTSEARYEVQFWPEGEFDSSVLIVSMQLPEGTPLPATVRLPLPVGAQVTWAGEIIGQEISNDILRPHTFVDGVGGQSIEFTLEETLTAQYDANYLPMEFDDGDYSVVLDWTQAEPAAATDFAIRLPGTVADTVIDPAPVGDPQINAQGERLYLLSPAQLEPGETQSVSVEYSRPELSGSTDSGGEIILWLLAGLVVAVVVLAAAVVISGRKQRSAEEG